MSKIIVFVTFKLNSGQLIEDWIRMSKMIDSTLDGIDGFISRDSTKNDDGIISCIVKWSNENVQKAYRKQLEANENYETIMQDFSKIVNLETMKQEFLEVL